MIPSNIFKSFDSYFYADYNIISNYNSPCSFGLHIRCSFEDESRSPSLNEVDVATCSEKTRETNIDRNGHTNVSTALNRDNLGSIKLKKRKGHRCVNHNCDLSNLSQRPRYYGNTRTNITDIDKSGLFRYSCDQQPHINDLGCVDMQSQCSVTESCSEANNTYAGESYKYPEYEHHTCENVIPTLNDNLDTHTVHSPELSARHPESVIDMDACFRTPSFCGTYNSNYDNISIPLNSPVSEKTSEDGKGVYSPEKPIIMLVPVPVPVFITPGIFCDKPVSADVISPNYSSLSPDKEEGETSACQRKHHDNHSDINQHKLDWSDQFNSIWDCQISSDSEQEICKKRNTSSNIINKNQFDSDSIDTACSDVSSIVSSDFTSNDLSRSDESGSTYSADDDLASNDLLGNVPVSDDTASDDSDSNESTSSDFTSSDSTDGYSDSSCSDASKQFITSREHKEPVRTLECNAMQSVDESSRQENCVSLDNYCQIVEEKLLCANAPLYDEGTVDVSSQVLEVLANPNISYINSDQNSTRKSTPKQHKTVRFREPLEDTHIYLCDSIRLENVIPRKPIDISSYMPPPPPLPENTDIVGHRDCSFECTSPIEFCKSESSVTDPAEAVIQDYVRPTDSRPDTITSEEGMSSLLKYNSNKKNIIGVEIDESTNISNNNKIIPLTHQTNSLFHGMHASTTQKTAPIAITINKNSEKQLLAIQHYMPPDPTTEEKENWQKLQANVIGAKDQAMIHASVEMTTVVDLPCGKMKAASLSNVPRNMTDDDKLIKVCVL